MAKHEVYITQLPDLDIQAKDIDFRIHSDGKLLGYLKVSKGAIAWRPNNGRKNRQIDWEQFDRDAREWPLV